MKVNDKKECFVSILKSDPVFDSAEIVSEVNRTSGLDSRDHTFLYRRRSVVGGRAVASESRNGKRVCVVSEKSGAGTAETREPGGG